jgi:hypothetical protein
LHQYPDPNRNQQPTRTANYHWNPCSHNNQLANAIRNPKPNLDWHGN